MTCVVFVITYSAYVFARAFFAKMVGVLCCMRVFVCSCVRVFVCACVRECVPHFGLDAANGGFAHIRNVEPLRNVEPPVLWLCAL